MLAAYDDPVGVTAAFNLNLLARINRELHANFDLHSFKHQARWNAIERRIEMHYSHAASSACLRARFASPFDFKTGETIWTEFVSSS